VPPAIRELAAAVQAHLAGLPAVAVAAGGLAAANAVLPIAGTRT
jgi:hypothetical protein